MIVGKFKETNWARDIFYKNKYLNKINKKNKNYLYLYFYLYTRL
jgi:hypothetical protein